MLKLRVLTALILLPLVMAAIFVAPAQWFMAILAVILLRGSWEYSLLAGLNGRAARHSMVVLQAVILATLFNFRELWASNALVCLSASCALWLLMFIRLARFRAGAQVDKSYQLLSFATAIVSITTGWFAISWLIMQPQGSWLLLMLLLIVWAADTGAYFAGINFGKKKLAPLISPGKTLAGLWGGLIAAPLIALLAASLMPITKIDPAWLVLLGVSTALVSVGGDLLISLHKRTSGVKDSGNLLPGHGGILDRVDSVIAAAPFFALGLLVSGI